MTSPGAIYLLRGFIKFSAMPTLLYCALSASSAKFLSVGPSRPLMAFAVISSTLLITWAKASFTEKRRRTERDALGAVEVPVARGERGWPGNIDLLLHIKKSFETGYPAEAQWEIARQVGYVWNFKLLGRDQIYTCEPEHIKQMLVTEFHNFEKGKILDNAFRSVLGSGVFNSDGKLWRFHRGMTRPFFYRQRISHFQILEKHASYAIVQMKQRLQEGHAVDVHDISCRYTLDCASEILIGTCLQSLHAGLPYPHNAPSSLHAHRGAVLGNDESARFAEALGEAEMALAVRIRLGALWPLWEICEDKTKLHMQTVDAYLDPILSSAFEAKQKTTEHSATAGPLSGNDQIGDDETLLHFLTRSTDDRKLVKDELLNILLAGRDTSAITIAFALYCLSQNPAHLSRLRKEIEELVGYERAPTSDDIKDMKYLRAVINVSTKFVETLRLYPPVPFNIRTSIKATTFSPPSPGLSPYYIPAGTRITYSVFMMHRREDLWGSDASVFDPSRFLDERALKYRGSNPFIFLPFNAGPRICLGQQLAVLEVSFILIRMLQSFSSVQLDLLAQPPNTRPPEQWKTARGRQACEEIFPKCHLLIYPYGGLWVRMAEAQAQAQSGNQLESDEEKRHGPLGQHDDMT